ncbi:hypothetical protein ACS0TY_027651 [Phlomoides rotata]
MEQSNFDSITTRVRHLRENIAELQKNYNQLTLNVKVSGNVQQANLDIVQTSINGVRLTISDPERKGKANSAYTSPSSKEKDHQERFQVIEPGKANHVNTSFSSKLEETEHQVSKPDVSGQPSTSGVKELILTLHVLNHVGGLTIHEKAYSKEWNSGQNILSLMYLEIIRDFRHLKEQIPLMFVDGTCLELSPQSVLLHQVSEKSQNYQVGVLMRSTSPDIITPILKEYPSFHFMKLQRPDKKAFTYIKEQETKPVLVINLTEDEISTRRARGV